MCKGSKQKIPRHILIKKEPVKTQKELRLVQPKAEQKQQLRGTEKADKNTIIEQVCGQ